VYRIYLKGPTGQIRLAREWYHLGSPGLGHTLLSNFLKFYLDFSKLVQNSKARHIQICQITNGLRGRPSSMGRPVSDI
jgi:hypothetical protein